MAGSDQPRSERIRAVIDEVDRVRREAESVAREVDQSLKQGAFWPDRRKVNRRSSPEHSHPHTNDRA
jgi:hypothetical protein